MPLCLMADNTELEVLVSIDENDDKGDEECWNHSIECLDDSVKQAFITNNLYEFEWNCKRCAARISQ